jgi:type VI secretion system secreted protein VgrG
LPRIGQEVVVTFLEGDPDRPLITGAVYNADQTPPNDLPAAGMISGFKSNSTKGGGGSNSVFADDTKSKEQLNLHAQYDMTTVVEHDQTDLVHNDRSISVDGKHTEQIKKDAAVTITEGNFSHSVAAGSATYNVKQDVKITITDGNFSHDVVAGSATYKVKQAVKENFDDTQTTKVRKAIVISSEEAEILVTAMAKIKLVTGDSSLSMARNGTIEIHGKKISIQGEDVFVNGVKTVNASSPTTTIMGTDKAILMVGDKSVICNNEGVTTSGDVVNSSASGDIEIGSKTVVRINC